MDCVILYDMAGDVLYRRDELPRKDIHVFCFFSWPYFSKGRAIGMSCRPSVCLSVRL